jgi:hypothetical protein
MSRNTSRTKSKTNKTKIPDLTIKELNFADIQPENQDKFIPFLCERDYLGRLNSSKSQISKDRRSLASTSRKPKRKLRSGHNTDRNRYPSPNQDSIIENLEKIISPSKLKPNKGSKKIAKIQIKEYPKLEDAIAENSTSGVNPANLTAHIDA